MSTAGMIANACVAAALFGLLSVIVAFVRWRSRQIRAMAGYRQSFFAAAHCLLSNDETPCPVVDQLEFMARHLDDPGMGRAFVMIAIFGRLKRAFELSGSERNAFISTLDAMPPPLRHHYGTAAAHALVAATFTNVMVGVLIRRGMLYWAMGGDPESKETGIVISAVESRYKASAWRCSSGAMAA